jgi:aryl-alcohol dehydrogenase-like predicted oxidoreductase
VPIPGTKKLRWLEQNVAAAAVSLSAPEVAALDAAVPRGLTKGDRYADMSAVNR